MTAETANVQPVQYLSFFIAGEEYAVNILEVKELIEYQPVTKVPSMPPFVRGVANLRGAVVPVIDLARRFGFSETQITKWTCIVMLEIELEGERTIVGVLSDSVSQVVELLPQDIEPPPSFGTRAKSEFLKGVGKAGQRFVLILDVDRLVTGADLATGGAAEEAGNPEEPEATRPDPAAAAAATGAPAAGESAP